MITTEDPADGDRPRAQAAHAIPATPTSARCSTCTRSSRRRPSARRCATGCRTAGIGCLDCKDVLLKHMLPPLEPIRERRQAFAEKPDAVIVEVLHRGLAPRARGRRAADDGGGPRRREADAMSDEPNAEARPDAPGRHVRGAARSAPASVPHQRDRSRRAAGARDHRPVPGPPRGDRVPRSRDRRRLPGHGGHAHLSQVQAAGPARSRRAGGAATTRRSRCRQELEERLREYARVKTPGRVAGPAGGRAGAHLGAPGEHAAAARRRAAGGPLASTGWSGRSSA